MQPIVSKLTPEEIVKAAELKQKVGGSFDDKTQKDGEGRRSAVKEYVKTFSGTAFSSQSIDEFYDWTTGNAPRYLRELIKSGHVTKVRQSKKGRNGYENVYYYHETPVPVSERTVVNHKKSNVTIRHEKAKEQEALGNNLELINQEAKKEKNKEREQFLVQLEVAVWEYIRDAGNIEAEENVVALKDFIKYHRNKA